ncbi:helix-turn-helix domain-containing protein [Streptomyces tauricus]|uniref:helix-turn-helix domain-containing protein n=1 Tax=Streptomyces tauricus TaxID=68274 RepID=UPI00339EE06E
MTTANDSPALPTPPALTPLRRARERFLTGLPLPDDVPAEVAAAWRRARFFGVPHDLSGPARSAPPVGSALLTAARPVLERLEPPLSCGQSAVVLTDERLRVLWSGGNTPHEERRPDLSEREVGHNSAALALRSRCRAEVHGPEHFLDLWQDVSAVSVPVLAPENGRVLGTVTVASGLCAERSPHPGAALAEATVAAVEAELLTRSRTAERVLLDAYQRAAARPGAAVVALDGRNRLLNEAAAGLLPPSALEALEALAALQPGTAGNRPEAPGRPNRPNGPEGPEEPKGPEGPAEPKGPEEPEGPNGPEEQVRPDGPEGPKESMGPDAPRGPVDPKGPDEPKRPDGPHGPNRQDGPEEPEAPDEPQHPDSLDVARQPGPCAFALPDAVGTAWVTRVRHEGVVIGVVAVIEPSAGVPAQPVGRPRVALAGRSVPWRHATSRAAELARSRGPLLLTGERGTGKTSLARELLAARGGPPPLVVDAAERPAADAITDWAETSMDGWARTSADSRAGTSTDSPAETSADSRAGTPIDDRSETSTDSRARTPANGRAGTSTDSRAETPADSQASASANDRSETSVDGRAGTSAGDPAITSAAGRPLLLRHAEQLASADVASLNSVLDAYPYAPLLVTYTPGTPPGPCLQRLLDSLAARSVALPALRERPDDLRELLAELTPRPAPGEPPLTWTLDALHALERHTWPGNITELAHLVRALAERRRSTGPVRRAELPDPVREGPPVRPLSPMEHAERTAILEALRSHGGNKARAAAALGIARATLYRKLRGYRG